MNELPLENHRVDVGLGGRLRFPSSARPSNATTYRGDVTDSTKLARDPGATTAPPVRAFQVTYNVADIVLINGKPAKGLMSTMNGALAPRVSPHPGLSIGDFDGGGPFMAHFTILPPDGTPVGAVWSGGGVLAPDMVSTIWAGSGAFLGMTGETRQLEDEGAIVHLAPHRTDALTRVGSFPRVSRDSLKAAPLVNPNC